MIHVTGNPTRHLRHKKILKWAKGFRGRSKNCYSLALNRVNKSLQYSYDARKLKKRIERNQWIEIINAATRSYSQLNYSEMIGKLNQFNIGLNRLELADLAQNECKTFESIIKIIKLC